VTRQRGQRGEVRLTQALVFDTGALTLSAAL